MVSSGGAWERQARRIADVCIAHLPVLTGVYVHGSAALGGFTHDSDLDVLVVGDGVANWPALGSTLLSAATDFPLELSVVAPRDVANPAHDRRRIGLLTLLRREARIKILELWLRA